MLDLPARCWGLISFRQYPDWGDYSEHLGQYLADVLPEVSEHIPLELASVGSLFAMVQG